ARAASALRLGPLGLDAAARSGARGHAAPALAERTDEAVGRRLLRARRTFAPRRARRGLDGVRVQPRLHEGAEALAPELEPALPLGRERHEHVLEPPERPLAVDRLTELSAEVEIVDHRNETLHPAVLLTRADRVDAEVVAVRRDPHMHL